MPRKHLSHFVSSGLPCHPRLSEPQLQNKLRDLLFQDYFKFIPLNSVPRSYLECLSCELFTVKGRETKKLQIYDNLVLTINFICTCILSMELPIQKKWVSLLPKLSSHREKRQKYLKLTARVTQDFIILEK